MVHFKLKRLMLLLTILIYIRANCTSTKNDNKNSLIIGNTRNISTTNSNTELNDNNNVNINNYQSFINPLLIKHFVIIRYYCDDMIKKEKLFDYSLLSKAINVFKKFTLKSLENQTNKNFEIILKIHNEISENSKAILELKSIKSSIKINILRKNETDNFIDNNAKEIDFLITTRIDHDDLIYYNAVNDVQKKCNYNIPLYYNGYIKGITMINNDYKNCFKFYPTYGNYRGTHSAFQSLVVNKKKVSKNLNIYSLGPHSDQIDRFKSLFNGFEFDKSFFNVNKDEDTYIYVKHDFNHSTFKNPKLREKWHRTNIKVNYNKEWFIERFGNFIDED